jgi:hypothetical protein
MATLLGLGWIREWKTGSGPITERPWSANDVAMVMGWVAILPHAAMSFEHDILTPPVSHLSAGGTFLVAAAAVLAELVMAALLARVLGTAMRMALRRAICHWRARRAGGDGGRPVWILFSRTTRVSSAPAVETYSWQV